MPLLRPASERLAALIFLLADMAYQAQSSLMRIIAAIDAACHACMQYFTDASIAIATIQAMRRRLAL